MRIDHSVPADQRTGVSVYYDDYKKRLAIDYSKMKPTSAFRRNNPHPAKNFLEPRRKPQEGVTIQDKVRQSVRNYLNDIYERTHHAGRNSFVSPFLYRPQLDNNDLEEFVYQSQSTPIIRGSHYDKPHIDPYGWNFEPLRVTGFQIKRPSSAIAAERIFPSNLEGESKREIERMKPKDNPNIVKWKQLRGLPKISPHIVEVAKNMAPEKLKPYVGPGSVRITEAIKEENRLKTPQPKREIWQRPKSSFVPTHKKPHWVASPEKKSKPNRIASAPPGVKGYTYYKQSTHNPYKMDNDEDMVGRLETWSKTATNYEKEVIYNMLKQISPGPNELPNTPMSEDFRKVTEGPAGDYHRPGAPRAYDNYRRERKTHSAPIKKMGGLVAAATQRPLHDQRVYRLKGQDIRLDPSPNEERTLNRYMNHLENVMEAPSKGFKRYASVPMHTHLPRKSKVAEDYQCKVSFFQGVRQPFRKHFIIHPDFTSETLKKRKPVNHIVSHIRY